MIELVATETSVVIVFSVVTAVTLALTTLFVGWIFFAVFAGSEENVRDAQRFIELTNEARAMLPSGLPLLDPEGAAETSAAIVRFQAKKDEARKALWQSRQEPAQQLASERLEAQPHPADEVAVAQSHPRRTPRRSAISVR
jgi:hypothetical protein